MPISGTFDKDNVVKPNEVDALEVDLGTAGVTWGAIESWATILEFQRGEVEQGSVRTLDGSNHVTPGSSLGPGRINVTVIYDEVATGPFENINAYFVANPGAACDVRWTPVASGNVFTSSGGYIVACSLPQADASDNEASRFTFSVICDDVGVS